MLQLMMVNGGKQTIVDGYTGSFYINPDAEIQKEMRFVWKRIEEREGTSETEGAER